MREGGDRPKARRVVQRRPLPEQPTAAPSRPTSIAPRIPHAPPYEGEQWETFITFLDADAIEQADFLARTWPQITFPRYAVQTLMPQLDAIGEQGWEPVSVQPVIVGVNGDVIMPSSDSRGLGGGFYSNQYLCVFKRRIK